MLRVRDIMSTDVVTVGPQTTIREAMELLTQRHMSGAPVVSGRATGAQMVTVRVLRGKRTVASRVVALRQ